MFYSKTNSYSPLPHGDQNSNIVEFDPESKHAEAHTEATRSPGALRQALTRNLLTTILAFYSLGLSAVLFATFANFAEKENNCNIGPNPAWKDFARTYGFLYAFVARTISMLAYEI